MTETIPGQSRLRQRHVLILGSFWLCVLIPLSVVAFYLFSMARDQFVSRTAFDIRTENISSAIDLLGGLSALGGASTGDADILYEYLRSQSLVRKLEEELELSVRYSLFKDEDPWFSYNTLGTIEDLTDYWNKMVKVSYDRGTGLIELRVHAFTAQDAQDIAHAVFQYSLDLVNNLSAVAREDAIRYARDELERSEDRLRQARRVMTEFRSSNRIVDPSAEIGVQTGLISALEAQLSNAIINYDVLRNNAGPNDPRLAQAEERVIIIRRRIEQEREKYAVSGTEREDYPTLVGKYESLIVDKEFSEQSYLAARAAYESALTEAQRKSRYLAAYTEPTLAERAEYPQRWTMLGLITFFLVFAWGISVLIFYAIKDRR